MSMLKITILIILSLQSGWSMTNEEASEDVDALLSIIRDTNKDSRTEQYMPMGGYNVLPGPFMLAHKASGIINKLFSREDVEDLTKNFKDVANYMSNDGYRKVLDHSILSESAPEEVDLVPESSDMSSVTDFVYEGPFPTSGLRIGSGNAENQFHGGQKLIYFREPSRRTENERVIINVPSSRWHPKIRIHLRFPTSGSPDVAEP